MSEEEILAVARKYLDRKASVTGYAFSSAEVTQ